MISLAETVEEAYQQVERANKAIARAQRCKTSPHAQLHVRARQAETMYADKVMEAVHHTHKLSLLDVYHHSTVFSNHSPLTLPPNTRAWCNVDRELHFKPYSLFFIQHKTRKETAYTLRITARRTTLLPHPALFGSYTPEELLARTVVRAPTNITPRTTNTLIGIAGITAGALHMLYTIANSTTFPPYFTLPSIAGDLTLVTLGHHLITQAIPYTKELLQELDTSFAALTYVKNVLFPTPSD